MESSTSEDVTRPVARSPSRRISRRVDIVKVIVPKAVDVIPPVDARVVEIRHMEEFNEDVLPVVFVTMEVEDVNPSRRTRRDHAEGDPNTVDTYRMTRANTSRPSLFPSRNRTETKHAVIVTTKILRPGSMSLDISPAI